MLTKRGRRLFVLWCCSAICTEDISPSGEMNANLSEYCSGWPLKGSIFLPCSDLSWWRVGGGSCPVNCEKALNTISRIVGNGTNSFEQEFLKQDFGDKPIMAFLNYVRGPPPEHEVSSFPSFSWKSYLTTPKNSQLLSWRSLDSELPEISKMFLMTSLKLLNHSKTILLTVQPWLNLVMYKMNSS